MRKFLGAVAAVMLWGCGGQSSGPVGTQDAARAADGLELTQEAGGVSGRFTQEGVEARFSSKQVEQGVYRVEVRQNGMTLTGLVDAVNGVSSLDGFAEESGQGTQMLDGDRALLSGLYAALNEQLPAGDAATAEAKYLRRAVGLWAQHPTTVELQRTVMGEQGRGYTMLCSYAKCNGSWTGSCGGVYNWYSYAKHDCQHGGFDATINQQIAQLGDHTTCSGDEYYLSGSTWLCGEPDHWSRPKVMGICFGRCGGGCGGDTQYTLDATNHDGCVRNGHALASAYCDDQFASASDDELYAPNCY
ncbi:hypothetical protein [Vitiosangium sp. GDMCC 1.1324]|uniref:hypothetical protein n=1 Tax=Vitiosangium sp. (strain GDMCC 1.1324) TaxID=2138576 RepID=UPI000D34C013|nr:hypothetical protein [Vitiosangium sp. GDMCC 1.1324]PTL83328.1 hypothetical protein DAT35_15205 [Vitiosangium sp. GDMCC 1.1324]